MGFLDDHVKLFFGRHVYHAGKEIHLPPFRNYNQDSSLDEDFSLYPDNPPHLLCRSDGIRKHSRSASFLLGNDFKTDCVLNRQEEYKALDTQAHPSLKHKSTSDKATL